MKTPQDKKNKQRRELLNALTLFSQMGISMAVCVVTGVFLGRFLDNFFGTSPWLLLIFSLIGAATSFKVMFDLGNKK